MESPINNSCVLIPLNTCSIVVWEVGKDTITYDVRSEDGERMEPRQTSKFEIKGDIVYFDKRFVSKAILRYCGQVTGTNVVPLS